MRALGIDLGSKRIGVAKTDPSGTLASPYCVLQRVKDRTALARELTEIIDEWEIEVVVIGMPLSLDGSVGPAAKRAIGESASLRDALSVPVETYDERLTTVSADRLLREAEVDGRKRREVIDMVAASVILQSWIDAAANAAAIHDAAASTEEPTNE